MATLVHKFSADDPTGCHFIGSHTKFSSSSILCISECIKSSTSTSAGSTQTAIDLLRLSSLPTLWQQLEYNKDSSNTEFKFLIDIPAAVSHCGFYKVAGDPFIIYKFSHRSWFMWIWSSSGQPGRGVLPPGSIKRSLFIDAQQREGKSNKS